MAVQTIYLLGTAAVTPNFFGNTQLNGSAPGAANSAFGWAPAKVSTATPYIRGRLGATTTSSDAAVASSCNAGTSGPTKGTGTGAATAGDSFIVGPFTGTFAATAWTFNFNMRAGTAGAIGHVNMRVWRSANADGSSATQLLANTVGATITLSTTVDQNSSISWSPGALNLNGQYLFFQIEWQETTAGSSNSDNVFFRIGTASITTADFTNTAGQGAAAGVGAATATGLADTRAQGTAAGFSPKNITTWGDAGTTLIKSNNNRDITGVSTTQGARASTFKTTGLWYCEIEVLTAGDNFGVADDTTAAGTGLNTRNPSQSGMAGFGGGWVTGFAHGPSQDSTGANNAGQRIGLAIDCDHQELYVAKDGTFLGTENPVTRNSPRITWYGQAGIHIFPWASVSTSTNSVRLHTQSATQSYAAPTGYTAWDAVVNALADFSGVGQAAAVGTATAVSPVGGTDAFGAGSSAGTGTAVGSTAAPPPPTTIPSWPPRYLQHKSGQVRGVSNYLAPGAVQSQISGLVTTAWPPAFKQSKSGQTTGVTSYLYPGAVQSDYFTIVREGLIAHWSLGDGTGDDLSGAGNSGIFTGGATPTKVGPIGNAVILDGSTGYVANDFLVNIPYASISVWVKTTSTSTNGWIGGFLQGINNGTTDKNLTQQGYNAPVWYIYASGANSADDYPNPINDGQWHHLVGTYESGAQKLYVDNVLKKTLTTTGPSFTGYSSPNIFLGGRSANAEWMAMTVDDFRVYNRAITATEVNTLYLQSGAPAAQDTGAGTAAGTSAAVAFAPFDALSAGLAAGAGTAPGVGLSTTTSATGTASGTGSNTRANSALGPFDFASGASNAISMRALQAYSTVGGLQIRRGSDNALGTFLPVAALGAIDVAAANTFLGGAAGYVSTVFDISGHNLSQATNANQPFWAAISSLGGKPSILFVAAGGHRLEGSGFLGNTDTFTVFAVVQPKLAASAGGNLFYAGDPFAARFYLSTARDSANQITALARTNDISFSNDHYSQGVFDFGTTQPAVLIDSQLGPSGHDSFINGINFLSTKGDTGSVISFPSVPFALGSTAGDTVYWEGDFCELIIYPRALTATERTGVRQNILNYYSLTPPAGFGCGAASGLGLAAAQSPSGVVDTGAGSASGTGVAAATGKSDALSVGTSAGTGTATSTGKDDGIGVGTAAGVGAATSTSRSDVRSAGVSAGLGTATSVGRDDGIGAAASAGTSTATATSSVDARSAGTSAGLGTGAAVGSYTVPASASPGTASGLGTALAGGSSDVRSAIASAGVGTATAVDKSDALASGSIFATSTATASGSSDVRSVGNASGLGSANGSDKEDSSAIGNAAGVGSGAGVIFDDLRSVGAASGSGSVSGQGRSDARLVGQCTTNVGTATGVGKADYLTIGNAAGIGSANAVSLGGIGLAGYAPGVGAATGVIKSDAYAPGTASGIGAATSTGRDDGIGAGNAHGQGSAVGFASVGATTGTASGLGTATAVGKADFRASASTSGLGSATSTAYSDARGAGTATAGVGTATATAYFTTERFGAGNAAGTGTAVSTGRSDYMGAIASAGVGTATATSVVTLNYLIVGNAAGNSTVNGVDRSDARAIGNTSGVGTATAIAGATSLSTTGNAAGVSTVTAVGYSGFAVIGIASGASIVTAISFMSYGVIGRSDGFGLASARSTSDDGTIGTASGIGLAVGRGSGTVTDWVSALPGTIPVAPPARNMISEELDRIVHASRGRRVVTTTDTDRVLNPTNGSRTIVVRKTPRRVV